MPTPASSDSEDCSLGEGPDFPKDTEMQVNKINTTSTQKVDELESDSSVDVCTGSKLKPEPGPYPRSSDPTRPDPTRAAQLNLEPEPDPKSPPPPITNKKKNGKDCISRLHAKKRINQGSAISQTFTSYESL